MTTDDNFNFKRANIILGIILSMVIALFCTQKCTAQTKQTARYDTIPCKTECIVKYITMTNEKTGKIHYYAFYADKEHNIKELVQCPQSVFDYVKMCTDNKIDPSLGIKLKNGQIQSLIRYRSKIILKR